MSVRKRESTTREETVMRVLREVIPLMVDRLFISEGDDVDYQTFYVDSKKLLERETGMINSRASRCLIVLNV